MSMNEVEAPFPPVTDLVRPPVRLFAYGNRQGAPADLLSLLFADTFPDTLSHSRASAATMYDSNGNLAMAPANAFNSHVLNASGATTSGAGSLGSPQAGGPLETYCTATHDGFAFCFHWNGTISEALYKVSAIVVRKNSNRYIAIGNNEKMVFDFDAGDWHAGTDGDGDTYNGIALTPVDLGDGWWILGCYNMDRRPTSFRVGLPDSGLTTPTSWDVPSSAHQVDVAGVFNWPAMAPPSAPLTLDDLITHSNGSAYYLPRMDHDTSGDPAGYLHEVQHTNKCVDYRFSNLTGAGVTVTAMGGAETGPNGTSGQVYRIQMSAAGGTYLILATGLASADWATSVWVKKYSGASDFALGTNGDYTRFSATDEWVRYSDVFNGTQMYLNNGDDSFSVDILAAFPQVEADYLTSYIPTYGAEATRQADVVGLTSLAEAISDDFTLYAEYQPLAGNTSYPVLAAGNPSNRTLADATLTAASVNQTTSRPRDVLYAHPSTSFQKQYDAFMDTVPLGTTIKNAFRVSLNDCRGAYNGTLGVADDGSSLFPSDIRSVGLFRDSSASAGGTTRPFSCRLKEARIIPRGLSDSQLQSLTAP